MRAPISTEKDRVYDHPISLIVRARSNISVALRKSSRHSRKRHLVYYGHLQDLDIRIDLLAIEFSRSAFTGHEEDSRLFHAIGIFSAQLQKCSETFLICRFLLISHCTRDHNEYVLMPALNIHVTRTASRSAFPEAAGTSRLFKLRQHAAVCI